MAVWSKLTTYVDQRPMNGSAHDSATYPRHKIDRVVIHHNSGTNYQGALNTWLKGGPANTSAHYEITPTQIIGAVDETRSAWHAGNKLMNQRSIGLEHVNSAGAPGWPVAEATLKLSAKLCADICKRYGIPIDSTHIIPHKSIVATDCPGGINMAHYINLVKAAAGQNAAPAETVSKQVPTYNTALNLALDGRWGAATTRKLQATYETYVDGVIDSQYPWPALTGNMTSVTWDKTSPSGSKLIKTMQKALGVKADGLLGPDTIKAMQRKAGLIVDGKLSTVSPLVKWMQKKLNAGQKPF